MNYEDLRGLNADRDVQDTEETVANLQEAASRAPVVIRPGAIRVQPDANGVVVLPAEVALGDIAVVGTDLVIELPDGTQWVIVDGAIFVPQLVIGDVEVPPTNLAALLIGEEPEPAAGQTQSSGGNFSVAVPDLGPPQPLGDLLPPTELDYTPPEPDLLGQFIEDDEVPNIVIETPDNPTGAVNATASVNESGLPEGPGLGRDAGESEGSAASGNGETTFGTFVYFSPDSPNVLAVNGLVVNGVVITGPGQIIEGAHGFLEIIAVRDGEIDFEYTLTDNTNGNNTTDVFSVTVTDVDGDSASANLTISIIDDVPTARDDRDYIAPGGMEADGNVMTGSGTVTGAAGADTEGADGAEVVNVTGFGETTIDENGNFVVQGEYGILTISANGEYTYTRDPLSKGGVEDRFHYFLEDGDTDPADAFLVIEIDDLGDKIDINPDPEGGDTVDESGLPPREDDGDPVGSGEGADGDPDNNSDTGEIATGTITWVDGDGENVVRINDTIVTGPGQQIPVEGGILTIISYDPDANVIEYSYTLSDNSSGEGTSITFEVSVTDADGDVATDDITINIIDDKPEAYNDSDTVAAGEYGPETGNVMTGEGTNEGAGGSGTDVEGADGASVVYIVGANGEAEVDADGVSIEGMYGTLFIDSDGNYSYVRHEGTPGGVQDIFTYTLLDTDGTETDKVTATLTISIEDSGVIVGENATVLVDDDALDGGNAGGTGDDPDAANLTGTLSGSGADEPIGFEFSTSGAPAGFTYVADGDNILIQQGGVTVITVTLDAATGGYTVTQNAPIDHAAGGNENNVEFTIGYTVTDVDGDSAGGSLTINADDDTPTIVRNEVATPDLMVDETDLDTNDSADFSGLFTVSEGADGGSTAWSLTLSMQGADSGLVDTATGQAILLYNNGDGTVEGRAGGEAGAVAFVVSVDGSGNVSLDQQRAIVHPDSPDNYDETVDIDGGVLSLTVTVTDGDGDVASQSADIGGSLNFDDDGPSAGLAEEFDAPSLAVDETDLGTDDSGNNYAGAFDLDGGADGTKSVVYSFTIVEGADSGLMTTDGTKIYLFTDADGNVEGRVGGEGGAVAFEVSVDDMGNVTLDQVLSLQHPNPLNHDEPVSPTAGSIQLTATITDGDDDTASASLDISGDISFDDDGPSAELAEEFQTPGLAVDETDLDTDADAVAYAGAFDLDGGADGTKSVVYSFTIVEGADSGLMTTDGTKIYLFTDADGNVEGRVGGEGGAVAFEVSVDDMGNVTLDQVLSLQHPNPLNHDEPVSPTAGSIQLTATITDGDDDTASASLDISGDISFDDDGPSVTASFAEDENEEMAVTSDADIEDSSSMQLSEVFSHDKDYGADGMGAADSVTYGLEIDGDYNPINGTAMTSGGLTVYLYQVGNTIYGSTSDNLAGLAEANYVFSLTVNPGSGQVDVVQYAVLDHAPGTDVVTLANNLINATYSVTVTDGDNDTATDSTSIDLGGNVKFNDDAPVAVDDLDSIIEGDINPATGNVITDADAGDAGDADMGADDVGNDTPATVVGIVTGTNDSVDTVNNGGGYPLVIDGDYGTLTINADGSYSYALDNSNPDVNTLPNLAELYDEFTYTIQDADGDQDSATLIITIIGSNGAPIVTAVTTDVSEEGLQDGEEDSDPIGVDDTNLSSQSGTFTFSDPDGDSLTWSISTPVGSYEHADGTDIVWVQVDSHTVEGRYGSEAGAAIVVATVDNDGNWTVDLNGPLNHGADGNTESEFSIVFDVVIDDGTEQTNSSITVRVEDDKPVVVGNDQQGDTIQTSDATLGTDSADYSGSFTVGFGGDGPNGGDADAATVYTLGFNAGATGIYDTATGLEVQLREGAGGVIEGFVNDGSDHVVFTISVDGNGLVTVDQDRSVIHRDGAFGAESDTPETFAADNLVTLTATATDEDGDTHSDTINIGKDISFADDAPVAANDTDTLDEDAVTAATGNVLTDNAPGDAGDSDAGADDVGNDVNSSVAVVDAVFGNAEGSPTENGNTVVNGTYGVLTIGADGNYSYQLTDAGRAALQSLDDGESTSEIFTYTMTDGDGDLDTALLTITLTGSNDAPTVNAQTGDVSEEGLPGGLADNVGVNDDTDLNSDSGVFTANDVDGEALTFSISAPNSGTYYHADGTVIYWDQVDSNTVIGRYGDENGAAVITATITNGGSWNVVLNQPMLHSNNAPNEGDGNIEGEFSIVFGVSVSDGTASTDTTLTVGIEDDKPVVDGLNIADPLQTDDTTLGTDQADYSSSFDVAFGGDGENGTPDNGLVYTLATAGGASGLTSGGDIVYLYEIGGNIVASTATVQGDVDNTNTVFTLSVDANGVVTMDQDLAVDHSNTGSYNESTSLSAIANLITLTATATDEDGDFDSHTLDITGDISILDDGLSVTATVTPNADMASGNDDGTPTGDATIDFGAVFGNNATFGNDGPADANSIVEVFGIALDSLYTEGDPATGLSSGGLAIRLYIDGNTVTGSTALTEGAVDGTNTVFTMVIDPNTGILMLTQTGPVDHNLVIGDPVANLATNLVNVTYSVTAKDGDNDTATDTAEIDLNGLVKFNDDTPDSVEGTVTASITLDESALSGDGLWTDTADFSTSFQPVDFGADVPGSVTYALLIADGGADGIGSGLYALDTSDTSVIDGDGYGQGDEIMLTMDGNDVVGMANGMEYFRISVDNDGIVTFTRSLNIWSDDTGSNDEEMLLSLANGDTLQLQQTVTDFDGDSDSSVVSLSGALGIEDDGPTAASAVAMSESNAAGTYTRFLDSDNDIDGNYGTDGGKAIFTQATIDALELQGLTSGQVALEYSISADGTVLTASKAGGGAEVFTITLDPNSAEDQYVLDLSLPLDALTTIDFNDGNYDFQGGNNPWAGFSTAANDDSQDLLITPYINGAPASTANTSALSGGVGGGQSVGETETLRIDFVEDLSGNNVKTNGSNPGDYSNPVNRDHSYERHYDGNGATAQIQDTGGSDIMFKAYDVANDGDFNVLNGNTQDTITAVLISYNGEQKLVSVDVGYPNGGSGVHTVGGNNFIVTFNADGTGGVLVENVVGASGNSNGPKSDIGIFTADGFNALEYVHQAGSDEFKVGDFRIAVPSADPVEFEVPFSIIDGDGDTVPSGILDITLNPPAQNNAFEKIALGDSQAANDDLVMSDLQSQSLMMSSALALGFAAAMPAKLAWDGLGYTDVISADLALFDVPSFGANFGSYGVSSVGFEGVSTVSVSLGGNVVGGQSNLIAAKEAFDVSLDSVEPTIEDAGSAPKGDTAQVAVVAQVALVDGGDIAMPGAEAIAAMVASKAGGLELAAVAKEALIDAGEGDVDALLAGIGDGHAGAPDAIATLMVVGQEALDAAYSGYLPANTDALLSDAMLIHLDAVGSAAHG